MSTILFIEIATLVFPTVFFRMPIEVDQEIIDCTNICPIAGNETTRNLTFTETSQNSTTLETLTNLTNLTNLTESGNNTAHADACLTYVAISHSGFFALAIVLMAMALYIIIEGIIMLCVVYEKCRIRTLSDRLLFDQEDLPEKVFAANYYEL